MLNAIAKPFGVLLLWLYHLVGNYGVAIFLFALVVKLILLPFQMKSKKSMMRMSALNPQLQELQKRHEGNPRKLQEETSKLYKEEHVSPMSGCLWSLIPFPILIALYQAIRFPLTVMMRVPAELVAEGGAIFTKLQELGFDSYVEAAGLSARTLVGYKELVQSQFISQHWSDFQGLSDKLVNINYKFLGLNLGDMPQWNFFAKCDWSRVASWLPAFGLFLIPIISAVLSWVQMKISQKTNPAPAPAAGSSTQQAQQASSMKMMNLMMPLVSLYIGFIMPAALGVYWIFNSGLAMIQEVILNKVYGKQSALESAAREERMRLRQAEYERKRQETERLREEGKTTENVNTSKKKQQARAKAELDELKAAAVRTERAAKRAALGIEEEAIPASQVGNRRYARGRAYVADRFTNPEHAAEETAAVEAAEAAAAAAEAAADAADAPETGTIPAPFADTVDAADAEEQEALDDEDADAAEETEDEEDEDTSDDEE
jgi:YidC/Oxa1 family membrane protein insertase